MIKQSLMFVKSVTATCHSPNKNSARAKFLLMIKSAPSQNIRRVMGVRMIIPLKNKRLIKPRFKLSSAI